MKKIYLLIIALSFILISPSNLKANDLAEQLKGRILLQVEEHGEAWYVNPDTKKRHFLGRPDDAFNLMRQLGIGVSEADYYSFNNYAPQRLSGKILLRVHANGEAYYVNPVDLKMHFLGRPVDAFNVMRTLGLGITNSNLARIESENNFLVYYNNNYSFKFNYSKHVKIEEVGNLLKVTNILGSYEQGDSWEIRIFNNFNNSNLSTWLLNEFNGFENNGCQINQSNLDFNYNKAILFSSKSMSDLCKDGGYYVTNNDNSVVLGFYFGHNPIDSLIINSLQFTK
jgi:hypothetical protein